MIVFVTGGTGTIGEPVVAELLAHGHSVRALARSDRSAAALTALGADPVRGNLDDLDTLGREAAAADGVVHLAFDHAAMTGGGLDASMAQESAATATLGEALVDSGKPVVVASGTPWIAGRVATEADPTPLDGPVAARARAVQSLLALGERGVRASAVRMSRTVHRDGRGGFAGLLTDAARRSGVAGYPGDGTQRWPAVHALDVAGLVRLALEDAPAGTVWHAVAEEGVPVRDVAEVIGRRLGLPVEAVGEEPFGALGPVFAMDQPASSAHTRATLGWTPTHPGLLADLENLTP